MVDPFEDTERVPLPPPQEFSLQGCKGFDPSKDTERIFADVITGLAKEYGVKPHEAQAIIWSQACRDAGEKAAQQYDIIEAAIDEFDTLEGDDDGESA